MKVSVLGAVSLIASLVSATTEELQIGVLKAIPEEECTVKTKAGDFISVHYEGSLEDGTVFDASYSRGQPITFQLGVGQVIPGWDQGLTRMCIGEKRKLIIPPNLAYGNAGIGPIPPKATLKLVDIAGAKKAPEMDEL